MPQQLHNLPSIKYFFLVSFYFFHSQSESVINYQISPLEKDSSSSNSIRVNADGLVESAPDDQLSSCLSNQCQSLLQIKSIPLSMMSQNGFPNTTWFSQSMFMNFLIRKPRYIMLWPIESNKLGILSNRALFEGQINALPVGGPFQFMISYHDELGQMFDVVSGKKINSIQRGLRILLYSCDRVTKALRLGYIAEFLLLQDQLWSLLHSSVLNSFVGQQENFSTDIPVF